MINPQHNTAFFLDVLGIPHLWKNALYTPTCSLWRGKLPRCFLVLQVLLSLNAMSHESLFCTKISCQIDPIRHNSSAKRKYRRRQLQYKPLTDLTSEGVYHSALTRLPSGSLIGHLWLLPHLGFPLEVSWFRRLCSKRDRRYKRK